MPLVSCWLPVSVALRMAVRLDLSAQSGPNQEGGPEAAGVGILAGRVFFFFLFFSSIYLFIQLHWVLVAACLTKDRTLHPCIENIVLPTGPGKFLAGFFLIEVQLIYNIVLVSGIPYSESVFFQIVDYYKILGILCYTVNPYCLSILCVIVCVH